MAAHVPPKHVLLCTPVHAAGEERVVEAAQQLLEALASLMGPLAQPHGAPASDDDEEGEGGDEGQRRGKFSRKVQQQRQQAATATAGVSGSSLAGYAAQLILAFMEGVARRHTTPHAQPPQQDLRNASRGGSGALEAVALPLVVRVAQQAPDSAVRNAALSLLAVLAAAKPQAVLSHVLEVREIRPPRADAALLCKGGHGLLCLCCVCAQQGQSKGPRACARAHTHTHTRGKQRPVCGWCWRL